jgi:glutaconate CoA-transferase subunit B
MSSSHDSYSRTELMIALLAREVAGLAHVAAGALSPLPAAAALLAQATGPTRATVLGSRRFNGFTEGGRELFDCAAEGRIDAFFLSGGQIDGAANINLVGIGDHAHPSVRFPGSFGSAYLYFLVPKVVLFREEHSRRSLVAKVDFISAPGTSPPGVYRRGGPRVLVTGLARFSFAGRFRLESIHPGHDLAEVEGATGFDFDRPEHPPVTPAPTAGELALIRGRIREELGETYPVFAATMEGAGRPAIPETPSALPDSGRLG